MDGYYFCRNADARWRNVKTTLAAVAAIVVLVTLPQISASGSFQILLSSYLNDDGVDVGGSCCSGFNRTTPCSSSSSPASSTCRTFFRLCLSHFQSHSSAATPVVSVVRDRRPATCSFGSLTTPVLGENSFRVPEALGSFVNPVELPFSFTWPGSYALTIEAWHDNDSLLMTPFTDPDNQTRRLLSRLTIQQALDPGQEWQEMRHSNETRIRFRYRVVCAPNYYGPGCSEICRPRNDSFGHYSCSNNGSKLCLEGWTGIYCNTARCLPGCHSVHGTCDEPNQCKCRFGWEGDLCDKCVPHPGCVHGSCREPGSCYCHPGWGGIFCNEDLIFCSRHRPCLNAATCINTGQGGYTCLCPPGFTGSNCEMDTNDCRSEHLSCVNGGLCEIKNGSSHFECRCPLGLTGRRCEAPVVPPNPRNGFACADDPCRNGGMCVPVPTLDEASSKGLAHRCVCPGGFTGINCEHRATTDPCVDEPCLNGGRCIHDPPINFRCACPTGYDGDRCEIGRNRCACNPCLNNGQCVDGLDGGHRCNCPAGFTGQQCELPVTSCSELPCANGATCRDFGNDFWCACADGFTGRHCTTRIGACASNPCLNAATCVGVDSVRYVCACAVGYFGRFCETAIIDSTDTAVTRNDSTMAAVTTSPPFLGAGLQLVVLICVGFSIPLFVLALSVICVVLRRRRVSKRRSLDLENRRNDARCLNNEALLPKDNINLKTVSQDPGDFSSKAPDPIRDKKNLLLQAQNDENSFCLKKLNNREHTSVNSLHGC